jgi:hypothetical protein
MQMLCCVLSGSRILQRESSVAGAHLTLPLYCYGLPCRAHHRLRSAPWDQPGVGVNLLPRPASQRSR